MTRLRNTLTLLLLCIALALHAQVAVEQKLDSMEMLIGEHVHLTLSATMQAGKHAYFPQVQAGSMITDGVEVLDVAPIDTQQTDAGKVKYSQVYTLTSFDDTLYYLPPLPVQVDGKAYKGNSLALKVMTVDVDTADKESMLIPFGVQTDPAQWTEWLPVALAGLAMAALVLLTAWLLRKLRSNRPIEIKMQFIRRLPAHQRALKALGKLNRHMEELNGKNTAGNEECKEYYTRLTDILRAYISERFGFNAKEMTTAEIMSYLRQQPCEPPSHESSLPNEHLEQILSEADLVKFARHSADSYKQERHMRAAMQYVNDTKSSETAIEEKKQQPLTGGEERIRRQRKYLKAALMLTLMLTFAAAVYIIWQINWLI